jgi:hypothetical protein
MAKCYAGSGFVPRYSQYSPFFSLTTHTEKRVQYRELVARKKWEYWERLRSLVSGGDAAA